MTVGRVGADNGGAVADTKGILWVRAVAGSISCTTAEVRDHVVGDTSHALSLELRQSDCISCKLPFDGRLTAHGA